MIKVYRFVHQVRELYRYVLDRVGIREVPTVKFAGCREYYEGRPIVGRHVDGEVVIFYNQRYDDLCITLLHELYHFIQHRLGRRKVSEVEADLWAKSLVRSEPNICNRYIDASLWDSLATMFYVIDLYHPNLYNLLWGIFSDVLHRCY